MTNKIYPCFWFDGNAGEAARFYSSIFSESKITDENPMVVMFESAGQKFMFLNGGNQFSFNPSISMFVFYENEEALVEAWNKLIEGGAELMPLNSYEWSPKYGWLRDKFGMNWQLYVGDPANVPQVFTPTLMFAGKQNGNAAKAIEFYTNIFEGSSVSGILKYTDPNEDVVGNVKHAQFSVGYFLFMAMDSSFEQKAEFNEAISFVVECETQAAIDYYWSKLSEGGSEGMCGWLKDRYGISWQIVPTVLKTLMSNPQKSQKVVEAFMQMKKFDIETLLKASH